LLGDESADFSGGLRWGALFGRGMGIGLAHLGPKGDAFRWELARRSVGLARYWEATVRRGGTDGRAFRRPKILWHIRSPAVTDFLRGVLSE
jgi:hypothetical protein